MKVDITDIKVKDDYSLTKVFSTSPGVADGVAPVTITIVVKNQGMLAAGFLPTFTVTGAGNSQSTCSISSALGVSTCYLRSTVAEVKTLTLTNPMQIPSINITFNPAIGVSSALAITSGGGITGGAGISSHSSIGIPFSPLSLEDATFPGPVRARTGIQGILFKQ